MLLTEIKQKLKKFHVSIPQKGRKAMFLGILATLDRASLDVRPTLQTGILNVEELRMWMKALGVPILTSHVRKDELERLINVFLHSSFSNKEIGKEKKEELLSTKENKEEEEEEEEEKYVHSKKDKDSIMLRIGDDSFPVVVENEEPGVIYRGTFLSLRHIPSRDKPRNLHLFVKKGTGYHVQSLDWQAIKKTKEAVKMKKINYKKETSLVSQTSIHEHKEKKQVVEDTQKKKKEDEEDEKKKEKISSPPPPLPQYPPPPPPPLPRFPPPPLPKPISKSPQSSSSSPPLPPPLPRFPPPPVPKTSLLVSSVSSEQCTATEKVPRLWLGTFSMDKPLYHGSPIAFDRRVLPSISTWLATMQPKPLG